MQNENNTNTPAKQTRSEQVSAYFLKPENIERLKPYFNDESATKKFYQTLMMIALDEKYAKHTPQSIFKCALSAAELNLTLQKNMGLCYLVPRKNKKTQQTELHFDMGYRGWLTLLSRANKDCQTYNVYKCDQFSMSIDTSLDEGFNPKIVYKPNHDRWNEADYKWVHENLRGILVVICSKDPGSKPVVRYVKRDILDKIKNMSPSSDSDYSPWRNWLPDMYAAKAIKTVISKQPLDEKIARAIEIENAGHIMKIQETRQLSALEKDLSGQNPLQNQSDEIIDVVPSDAGFVESKDEQNPYFADPIPSDEGSKQ